MREVCSDDLFWKRRIIDQLNLPRFDINKYNGTSYRKLYEILSNTTGDIYALGREAVKQKNNQVLTYVVKETGMREDEWDDKIYIVDAIDSNNVDLIKIISNALGKIHLIY